MNKPMPQVYQNYMARHLLLIASMLFVFLSATAQDLYLEWAAVMKGKENDYGRDIKVDKQGNVYSIGSFNTVVDLDPGKGEHILRSEQWYSVYVQKLNPNGELVWGKKVNGIYWGQGFSLDLDDEGNIYAVGSCRAFSNLNEQAGEGDRMRTMFVLKLNPNGEQVWAKGFRTTIEVYAKGVAVGPEGNIHITGGFKGQTDFDPGSDEYSLLSEGMYDCFTLKLNPQGGISWARSLGSKRNDYGFDVDVDIDGNCYVTGAVEEQIHYDVRRGIVTTYHGSADMFVTKMDKHGDTEWIKTAGSQYSEQGTDIHIDKDNNVLVAGYFMDEVDLDPGPGVAMVSTKEHPNDWVESMDNFVLKLDPQGNHIWSKGFGGTYHDHPYCITTDHKGNVYTAGIFHKTVDFDPGPGVFEIQSAGQWEGFVQKLTSEGEFEWAFSNGSPGWDFMNGVDVDSLGYVYTTGYFTKKVDLDPNEEKTYFKRARRADAFVQKIRPFELAPIEEPVEKVTQPESTSQSSESQSPQVTVFPNPASTAVQLSFLKQHKKVELKLIDSSGKVVMSSTTEDVSKVVLDLREIASGHYVIDYKLDGHHASQQLVVEK
jgi:hypothetical protein